VLDHGNLRLLRSGLNKPDVRLLGLVVVGVALLVVLEVLLDDELELDDYLVNFRRMYGNPRMDAVLGSVDGSVRFFGLTPTSMKLEGLDRHRRLIDSVKKLHVARAKVVATAY
jgi:ribosomal protein S12 methylthiotransferase accessory factor